MGHDGYKHVRLRDIIDLALAWLIITHWQPAVCIADFVAITKGNAIHIDAFFFVAL